MGRDSIYGIVKTKNLEKWYKQAQEQAAYQYGHSYSGQINMLDDMIEYTERQFKRDLNLSIPDKDDFKFMGTYEKISEKKIVRILKSHKVNEELTFADFVKFKSGKKIQKWKTEILNYRMNVSSDIFWYIPIGKDKYYWFGWARC